VLLISREKEIIATLPVDRVGIKKTTFKSGKYGNTSSKMLYHKKLINYRLERV